MPARVDQAFRHDNVNSETIYVDWLVELGKRQAVAIAEWMDRVWVQQMLDVAGGSGIYSVIFAQRQPTPRAMVFDLPPIVPFAQEIIARYGRQERVTAYPGNYFQADVAGGGTIWSCCPIACSLSVLLCPPSGKAV